MIFYDIWKPYERHIYGNFRGCSPLIAILAEVEFPAGGGFLQVDALFTTGQRLSVRI